MTKKIVAGLALGLAAALAGVGRLAATGPAEAQKEFDSRLGVSVPELRKTAAPETAQGAPVSSEALLKMGWWERDRDRGRGPWGRDCRAFDNGHEEHYGGHRGCGDCLKPPRGRGDHDNCNIRCREESFRCTYEWLPDDPNGRRQEHRGERDRDRQAAAEDDAQEECRWQHRSEAGRCRFKDCDRRENWSWGGSC